MKSLIITLILFNFSINAQEKNKKLFIDIKGNCEMCKNRIEKAANKVKGVKYASWDISSKELTLIIDEFKCAPLDVKIAIAKVGHDSDEVKAKQEVYDSLPFCCKFRDPNTIHMNHNNN